MSLKRAVQALIVGMTIAGCGEIPPSHEDLLPEISTMNGKIKPTSPFFGYNPARARRLYNNPNLEFVNFTPKDDVGRRALAQLLVYPPTDFAVPAWARVLSVRKTGDAHARLNKLGFLPTPFDYQMRTPVLGGTLDLSLNESSFTSTETGSTYVGNNCLWCHAGLVGNQVVIGLPNKESNLFNLVDLLYKPAFTDIGKFEATDESKKDKFRKLTKLAFLLQGQFLSKYPELNKEELSQINAVVDFMSKVFLPIATPESMVTVGVNTGPATAVGAFSYLVPNGETFDTWPEDGESALFSKLLDRVRRWKGNAFPVWSGRPWWLARYSGSHFYIKQTPGDISRSAADLALNFISIDFGQTFRMRWKERYDTQVGIQTYISQIKSPPFPGQINWDLATLGYRIFHGEVGSAKAREKGGCAGCHGKFELAKPHQLPLTPDTRFILTYDIDKSRVPYEIVGTDKEMYEGVVIEREILHNVHSNKQAREYNIGFRGPSIRDIPWAEAVPLVGVWSSAPYLHNGSVPTLYHVLNSRVRPTRWRLDDDRFAYDYKDVGVVFTEEIKARPGDLRTYDTTRRLSGMSNQGHKFGDKLSDIWRYALIEFLKTITTENTAPNPIGKFEEYDHTVIE